MDINYLLFLQKARTVFGGIFDQFFLFITELATPFVTFLLMAFVYWCYDKRIGALMGWNVGIGGTLSATIKRFFNIDRPWVRDSRITPVEAALSTATDASFPSGHTIRATANWGVLGTGLINKKSTADTDKKSIFQLLSIICWAIVALVMFSRNYLGVHTPQDVLTALVIGIALIWVTNRIMNWADVHQGKYDLPITIVGMVICFVPMLRYGCMSNCGAGMGLFAGWYAERKWVHFSTEGSNTRKLARYIIGAIPAIVILKTVSPMLSLFMESKYAGFFTYGMLGFYIMAIYPFIFNKVETAVDEGKLAPKQVVKRTIAALIALALLITAVGYGRNRALQQKAIEQEQEAAANLQVTSEGLVGYMPYVVMSDGSINTSENMGYQLHDNGDSWYFADGLPDTVDDSRKKMDVIGHRGYPAVAPENTMPSFKYAMELGVDWIETDVQLTKDNVLVLFHDNDLARITGVNGTISDYTYDELCQMDFGKWFSDDYADTRIPKLQELLDLVKDDDVKIYLELKDIGEADGFVQAIYDMIEASGMHDRVVYASFNYSYLQQFKAIDASVPVLCNTMVGNTSILIDTPAEYYGIYAENATTALVNAIHAADSKVFVFTPDSAQQIQNMYRMGVDGVCTNQSGIAMVASYPEYSFVADNCIWSHVMPGLYEQNLPEQCADMIWQGFTKTPSNLIAAAYSSSGQYNSILYVMDLNGNLQRVVDMGFIAHMGGIAYDSTNDILWTTGPEGMVYAFAMNPILDGTFDGQMVTQFDAGLYNAAGGHVASFLAIDNGMLYVGSYCDGGNGALEKFDISDVTNPQLVSTVTIPDRIQGVTFREKADGTKDMLLTQGYEMYDGRLMQFSYSDDILEFLEPNNSWHLPEGPEQILWTPKGLYIQFESSALPYRPTARNAGDQLWILQLPE